MSGNFLKIALIGTAVALTGGAALGAFGAGAAGGAAAGGAAAGVTGGTGAALSTTALGQAALPFATMAKPVAAGLSTWQKVGLIGVGLSGLGAFQQAQMADANASFNARLQELNARNAEANARLANLSAEEAANRVKKETRRRIGAIRTAQAKSGVVTTEGSPLLVQQEQAQEGAIEAGKTLYAGRLEAQGFGQQAQAARLQASAFRSQKRGTFSNAVSAGSTILTGASSVLK